MAIAVSVNICLCVIVFVLGHYVQCMYANVGVFVGIYATKHASKQCCTPVKRLGAIPLEKV